jgi:hypothetical protein
VDMSEGGGLRGAINGTIDVETGWLSQSLHRMDLAKDNAAMTSGQGFTLSLEQAHSALKDVNGFLTELGYMKLSAQGLQQLKPPAQDIVSVDYNGKLTQGALGLMSPFSTGAAFDAAVTQIDAEIKYLETLREKLYKALGMTAATDVDNKKAIDQAGANHNEAPGGIAG